MLEEEGHSGTIPDAIRNLCGTTLIFRLKLTSRNLQECMENYKVNCTFVPNNQLEQEYSNDRAEEVCPSTILCLPHEVQNFNSKLFYRTY